MIAIYARQSIEKKDSISIESQINFAKRELTGELTEETFTIFSDSGYSGKDMDRPAFADLLAEIKSGNITKVIVYRLDRISRSLVDFADFMDMLEAHHVSFISATEKFDTTTPMGRAMLYIVVVFAQLERETIAERVKDNYYSRVRQGAWGGGPAPFGFQLVRKAVDGKKVTHLMATEKMEIIKRIFAWYETPHITLSDLQKNLADEVGGVQSWTASKLSAILKNPVYVKADATIYEYYQNRGAELANEIDDFQGDFACQLIGKRTEASAQLLSLAPHKGIIESQCFLYCQEKLNRNRQIKNQFKGTHSYLTGLLKCGYCGYAFSVKNAKTSQGDTAYFSCSGRYLHKCCHAKQTHRVAEVETVIAEEITNYIREIIIIEETQKEPRNETEKIERQLTAKINCLLDSLSESPESAKAYILNRIASLHEEKAVLDCEKRVADETMASNPEMASGTSHISCSDFDWSLLSFEQKKEMARLLIQKVVLKQNEICIVLKTSGDRA